MIEALADSLRAALANGDATAVRNASDAASNYLATVAPSGKLVALEALVLQANPSPFASADEARRNS